MGAESFRVRKREEKRATPFKPLVAIALQTNKAQILGQLFCLKDNDPLSEAGRRPCLLPDRSKKFFLRGQHLLPWHCRTSLATRPLAPAPCGMAPCRDALLPLSV